jgi:hypothetical protein
MRGLDPRSHADAPSLIAASAGKPDFSMDCRVKPGNDAGCWALHHRFPCADAK